MIRFTALSVTASFPILSRRQSGPFLKSALESTRLRELKQIGDFSNCEPRSLQVVNGKFLARLVEQAVVRRFLLLQFDLQHSNADIEVLRGFFHIREPGGHAYRNPFVHLIRKGTTIQQLLSRFFRKCLKRT